MQASPHFKKAIYDVGEQLEALLININQLAAARMGLDLKIRIDGNGHYCLCDDETVVVPIAINFDRGLYSVRIDPYYLKPRLNRTEKKKLLR
jgi:hypothetical protein